MTAVKVYTAAEAAELLGCTAKQVEALARTGELPGIQPGRGWVFPAGALATRLDQMALEHAAARRKPISATAVATTQAPQGAAAAAKPRRGARPLPKLVDLGHAHG